MPFPLIPHPGARASRGFELGVTAEDMIQAANPASLFMERMREAHAGMYLPPLADGYRWQVEVSRKDDLMGNQVIFNVRYRAVRVGDEIES